MRSRPGSAASIVITPSHNPPSDGGFKYNPPHGGPAETAVTAWIEARANALLGGSAAGAGARASGTGAGKAAGGTATPEIRRVPYERALAAARRVDFAAAYVRDLAAELRKCWNVDFDDAGAIGRRYRRQDEIGTPFCVTVDFDTLEDQAVTIRERDAMTQDRVALDGVSDYLAARLIEQMEQAGLVSAMQSNGNREVLVPNRAEG